MLQNRSTEWIRQGLVVIADDLDTYMTGDGGKRFTVEIAENLRWRLEMMLRDMFALDFYGELARNESQSLHLFSEVYKCICDMVRNLSKANEPPLCLPIEQPPAYHLPQCLYSYYKLLFWIFVNKLISA